MEGSSIGWNLMELGGGRVELDGGRWSWVELSEVRRGRVELDGT